MPTFRYPKTNTDRLVAGRFFGIFCTKVISWQMFAAFTLEAIAVFMLLRLASHPVWFIALSGLWAMIACDLVSALMALFWLKPLAARTVARALSRE